MASTTLSAKVRHPTSIQMLPSPCFPIFTPRFDSSFRPFCILYSPCHTLHGSRLTVLPSPSSRPSPPSDRRLSPSLLLLLPLHPPADCLIRASRLVRAALQQCDPLGRKAPRSSPAGRARVTCMAEDRWAGLGRDISDDQQDITRGKGMVDAAFQGGWGQGTHAAVLSSYDYMSQGQRNLSNVTAEGLYIAPAFMDKMVVHICKNFMQLPNIRVPLILGIWGGKGQGKSFQCELVFAKMGINPIMISAGELESGNAGEPAKLIRQRYREASDLIKKGKMCALFINDLDAGAGRMGGTTQYTVNNQMVNATLMNIADNPTNVQMPGIYNKEEINRVPIILVDTFPGQSIDFFGALRARVYDDLVRNWVGSIGIENMGKKLVNSRSGPPEFEKPSMPLSTLLEYGHLLVFRAGECEAVQLADTYLNEAALGNANADAISRGTFDGGRTPPPAPPAPAAPRAAAAPPARAAAPAAGGVAGGASGLEGKSLGELRALARQRGVRGDTKAELIKALSTAPAAAAAAPAAAAPAGNGAAKATPIAASSLANKSLGELRALARQRGVRGDTKAELISLLSK
ncbi:unnamed protein product [Closterium sp. NIES-64]|nr:unnamed protein product [Closterium sp. NIES-64]